MNRRSLLRFLALAPLAAPVAIVAARDVPAAGAPAGGVRALLANSKHQSAAEFWGEVADQIARAPAPAGGYLESVEAEARRRGVIHHRHLTEAERIEFRRRYIDPMEAELLESRRFTIDEICKFMGVPRA